MITRAIILLGILMILLGKRNVPDKLQRWALAVMEFEGYSRGSRSERNNNPGNLKYAGQAGAIGKDEQNHAIFETFEAGWNALIRQLRAAATVGTRYYKPDMSLYEFYSRYAEANSSQYAEFVARQIGVTPDTPIGTLVV